MPVLVINRTIEQREPTLLVENRLAPGLHRFSLVVVDDSGNASEPDFFTVTVRRAVVVDPVRPPVTPIRPVIVDPVIRPPISGPLRPPAPGPTPLRPRSAATRKGKKHGPE
ncbi:hypothetical protein [Piscinibacter sakaiensis]|uniref:hypothetical protein n=1 Tax=Piscinibacter sakaiensis TaxID=1547922 RepID=UPI003AB0BC30